MSKFTSSQILVLFLTAAALLLAACGPAAQPAPVTVVVTQEVEVTRIVEILSTVEVTRQVESTVVVEVPVTVTPTVTPEITATPTPTASPTFVPVTWTPEATPLPAKFTEKIPGFAFLKIVNLTKLDLIVEITGPVSENFRVLPEKNTGKTVPEGEYTYRVLAGEKVMYSGTMKITNPDKHELRLREDKAVFWIP
jgi:hypothetical protein